MLRRLRTRHRADGVDTVLVNAQGLPWNLDTLSKEVSRIAKKAGIVHVEPPEPGKPPVTCGKHMPDMRGASATKTT